VSRFCAILRDIKKKLSFTWSINFHILFYLDIHIKRGAIFDLTKPTVVLSLISEKPIISLLPTSATDGEKTLSLFGANNIFCSMTADISDEEAQLKLQQLLQEFDSIFDPNDKSPAKTPVINIPLKPEFKNKVFFRPEPLHSQKDQEVIDKNAEQLIKEGRAFYNPKSRHNIGQVIVPRLDKNNIPIVGRERVCLDLKPVNKCLEHYEYPIPRINKILRELTNYKYFSEGDLDSGYHQFRISKELADIFTFSCSRGKVSMGVLPFGVFWAASIFQETMCSLFLELLLICLKIYIDNLIVHSLSRREHLVHLREVFQICKDANLHLRLEKCTFMVTSIKTLGFIISHGVIQPDPLKIDMLTKAPPPADRTALHGFLALLQQFRSMLVHLSHACHKLYELKLLLTDPMRGQKNTIKPFTQF
jgi:hypothetical protein